MNSNPKSSILFFIPLTFLLFYSCSTSEKNDFESEEIDSTKTSRIETVLPNKINKSDEIIIDTLIVSLDNDQNPEKIVIYKGEYELASYKFIVYDYSGEFIAEKYSYLSFPWIDSLENGMNPNKILWTSFYSNGNAMGGMVYFGNQLIDGKLINVISIPGDYYGSLNIGAPEGSPFKWGNIKLQNITYQNKNSIFITVSTDLHESPSWETMDSLGKTVYENTHILNYIWNEEKNEFLVHSLKDKKRTYHIENIYDMKKYLRKEFNLK